MVLEDTKAGFHFVPHTYTPATIRVVVCSSCGYLDVESERFKNEVQRVRKEFFRTHSPVTDDDQEDIEEILHRAAEEWEEADLVTDPKDAKVCRRCGTAARHKHARFCFKCGNPLSPDGSDPAIINPMLAAISRPAMALNPLQFFDGTSLGDSMPPLALELLENVVRAAQQVYGKRATLHDVHRFLTDQDFRDATIGKLNRMEDSLRQRYLRDAFDPHPGEAETNA